jgi:hypothetical protein
VKTPHTRDPNTPVTLCMPRPQAHWLLLYYPEITQRTDTAVNPINALILVSKATFRQIDVNGAAEDGGEG